MLLRLAPEFSPKVLLSKSCDLLASGDLFLPRLDWRRPRIPKVFKQDDHAMEKCWMILLALS